MTNSPAEDFGAWRVAIRSAKDRGEGKGVYALARAMGITNESARSVLKTAPFDVPINFSKDAADELSATLTGAGLSAEPKLVAHASATACRTHPKLANEGQCSSCGAWVCVVCKSEAEGAALCSECYKTHGYKTLFRHTRVAILLAVLIGVVSWGWNERHEREVRREWQRPVKIGVVVLARNEVPQTNVDLLGSRLEDMESVLTKEFRRYKPDRTFGPIDFQMLGMEPIAARPPLDLPEDAGLIDNIKLALEIRDYVAPAKEALGLDTSNYDSIMYVVVTTPEDGETETFVEGLSEVDGEIGLIEVDLDASMANIAAIAVAHEAFHSLGASDKYDASGFPILPNGLAEPGAGYPQKYAEIMGRMVATSETTGRMPGLVGDIKVNDFTAREIGWIRDRP